MCMTLKTVRNYLNKYFCKENFILLERITFSELCWFGWIGESKLDFSSNLIRYCSRKWFNSFFYCPHAGNRINRLRDFVKEPYRTWHFGQDKSLFSPWRDCSILGRTRVPTEVFSVYHLYDADLNFSLISPTRQPFKPFKFDQTIDYDYFMLDIVFFKNV